MLETILTGGASTILGAVVGGGFRLGQAFLDAREKQRDRDHEHRMSVLHGEQAERAGELKLREVGLQGEITLAQGEIQAMMAGVQAQATEAQAAGGTAAWLSATVRPIVTYGLVILYAWHKASLIAAGAPVWGSEDMALLSSILAFWFADRSLRRGRSPLAA